MRYIEPAQSVSAPSCDVVKSSNAVCMDLLVIADAQARYINANAETLRKKFVSHEGQKELVVYRTGSRYTVDFAGVADEFTALMEKNIVDPSLRGWIMQNFSTTTHVDRTVYAISMMASLQKFFSFECCITCGLPSVTLEGEREDWVKLRESVERLGDFGEESVEWRELLRVVLGKFVECFDNPDAQSSKDFWNRIATHESMGSGPSYWNGWISAFCMWGSEGKKLRPDTKDLEARKESEGRGGLSRWESPLLVLDGVIFHRVDSDAMPPGWVSVPVKVNDNGNIFMTRMIAGAVAVGYESSGLKVEHGEVGLDTLRPVVGWWMFESKSREDVEREEREEEERWMEEFRKKYESKS